MSGERTTLQTPIGARLRAETRHQHAAVEGTLAFLVPDVRPAAYRAFLARWHGFHRVVEPRLDAWHLRARLLDWPPRRKLRLLEDDLRALGVGGEQVRRLPVCPDVPAVGGTATALGVLYVVEGSTLGGAVLRRRLADGRIPADAFGFLSSYGDEVGPRWRGYRAASARWVDEHPEDGDRVVAAARRTFDVLTTWIAGARIRL